MRSKLTVAALTAIGALTFSTAAQAANEYTTTFTTNPTKSGTSKRPAPVSGTFGFSVRDTEGKRPLALDAIRVTFTGMRINTRQFRGCTAARITQDQSDRRCPSAALMATGFANNIAGNINDRNDQSIRCGLQLRLYNSGSGKMALFVRGAPNLTPSCPIEVATAIPVSITRTAQGDRLAFTIPDNLKTPLATLRNSLVETRLTLRRRTVRTGGRTVGFFETVGRCRKGRRAANIFFDNEGSGSDITQSAFARCSS
jgi:hypothetical protein